LTHPAKTPTQPLNVPQTGMSTTQSTQPAPDTGNKSKSPVFAPKPSAARPTPAQVAAVIATQHNAAPAQVPNDIPAASNAEAATVRSAGHSGYQHHTNRRARPSGNTSIGDNDRDKEPPRKKQRQDNVYLHLRGRINSVVTVMAGIQKRLEKANAELAEVKELIEYTDLE
jgi:hypothetical protein